MYSSFTNRIDSFEIPVTEVQQQNQAWRNMQSHWGLIEDLIEGTSKIRGKARIYLKQEPREEDKDQTVPYLFLYDEHSKRFKSRNYDEREDELTTVS